MSNQHTIAQEGPIITEPRKPFDRWSRFLRGTWVGTRYHSWKVAVIHKLERIDGSTPHKKKLLFFWCFMTFSVGFFVFVTIRELKRKVEPIPIKKEAVPGAKKNSPAIILDENDLKNIDKLTEGAVGDSL